MKGFAATGVSMRGLGMLVGFEERAVIAVGPFERVVWGADRVGAQ